MQIDVRITYNGKEIDAEAVLDSGAEGVYCNTSFIKKYSLPTYDIELPVYPRNVNGTLNKQGAICHAAILRMGIGTRHWENIEVAITNTGRHKILLGTDWLKAHNPSIDWSTNQLCFDRCPPQCYPIEQDPTIGQFLPIDAWETQNDDYLDYTDHGTDVSQHIVAHKARYFEPMIQKTVVSTTLAKGEEHKTMDIPSEFRKYAKVFLDEEALQLPKHQPWDHKIDLQPGLQMRKTSVYRLTPPVTDCLPLLANLLFLFLYLAPDCFLPHLHNLPMEHSCVF